MSQLYFISFLPITPQCSISATLKITSAKCSKLIFSSEMVMSDNGPQFACHEMADYFSQRGK